MYNIIIENYLLVVCMFDCLKKYTNTLKQDVYDLFQPDEPTISGKIGGLVHNCTFGYFGTKIDERTKIVKIINEIATEILKKLDRFVQLFYKKKPEKTVWQNLKSVVEENGEQFLNLALIAMPTSSAIQALKVLNTIQNIYNKSTGTNNSTTQILEQVSILQSLFQKKEESTTISLKDHAGKLMLILNKASADYPAIHKTIATIGNLFN